MQWNKCPLHYAAWIFIPLRRPICLSYPSNICGVSQLEAFYLSTGISACYSNSSCTFTGSTGVPAFSSTLRYVSGFPGQAEQEIRKGTGVRTQPGSTGRAKLGSAGINIQYLYDLQRRYRQKTQVPDTGAGRSALLPDSQGKRS